MGHDWLGKENYSPLLTDFKESLGLIDCHIVVRKRYTVKWRVNYLLTEVVQSNKYYKSRVVGVMSEIVLTTDQDLAEPLCLRNTTSFIPPRYRKLHGMNHYTTQTTEKKKGDWDGINSVTLSFFVHRSVKFAKIRV